MAEHTQNAMRDPRASLLVTEPVPDGADPLASGRVTLLGRLSVVADEDRPARPRPLPRGEPDGGLLHRLRRLRLLPPRRAEHPLRRWLRADELGRPGDVRGGRTGSARRGRGRDHRAHERRPRRCAGPVLPSPRWADPTPPQATMTAVDRYGFEMIAVERRRSRRGPPRLPARVHDRRSRSAKPWSPWWRAPGPPRRRRHLTPKVGEPPAPQESGERRSRQARERPRGRPRRLRRRVRS